MSQLIPLFAAEFLLIVGNGITFTAVAARAMAAGLDSAAVGAAGSAFYAGLFAVYALAPRILARVGLRTAALLAPVACGAGLMALLAPQAAFWFPGRAVMGIGIGLFYITTETWITIATSPERRGLALSLYMAVFFGANIGSQLFLLQVSPLSGAAIACPALALLLALAVLTRARPPRLPPVTLAAGWPQVAGILCAVPVPLMGTAVTGMAASAFFSLGPLYAIGLGFQPERVAAFSLAVLAGAALAQLLIGRLAQRHGARPILFLLCIQSVAAAAWLIAGAGPVALAVAAAWGMAALTAYALAAALAYNAPHGRPMAEVARVVLTMNGLGGVLGPISASSLDWIAPGQGFPLLALLAYVLFALALLARSPPPGPPRKRRLRQLKPKRCPD